MPPATATARRPPLPRRVVRRVVRRAASRRPATGRAKLFVAAALCPVLLTGCNLFMIAAYLIAGPPSVEPDYEVATRSSLTEEDAVVAVVCYAPTDLKSDIGNETIDRDLARYVSQKLTLNKIAVRRPDQVSAWLARNPDWEEPSEIGDAMQVTHVIYIDLSKFSLYEENSADLYRGRAEAIVTVVTAGVGDEATDEWEDVYNRDVVSRYPLAVPRSASAQGLGAFKKEYLSRLSEDIGRLFYPHWNGDDFNDAA